MDEMDRLLALKRHDFKCHMQALAQRRAKLEQKQQEVSHFHNTFSKAAENRYMQICANLDLLHACLFDATN